MHLLHHVAACIGIISEERVDQTYFNSLIWCLAMGFSRTTRDVPPAHYTFKIESYSRLLDTEVEKYETGEFQAGDYSWRLCLYPNGDEKLNGNGYISLYLQISDTDSLPQSWEVNVDAKLFVFDQRRGKYLTIQDATGGGVWRFHGSKTEWGFPHLISLDTFNESSNGYLLDNSCIFGAEVFVINYSGKRECLSMVERPQNNTYTWKMEDFSELHKDYYHSPVFTVGGRHWKLKAYPNGNSKEKGKELSVFLYLDDVKSLPPKRKVYAEYKIQILDQVRSNHHEQTDKNWFSASSSNHGHANFMSLSDLNQASKVYLKNDTLIINIQFLVISVVKNLS